MLHSPSLATEHEAAMEELAWSLSSCQAEFKPIFARCNCLKLRDRMAKALQQYLQTEEGLSVQTLVLPPKTQSLHTAMLQAVDGSTPQALIVLGLEVVETLDTLLANANSRRPQFRRDFPFNTIIWVTDAVLAKWIRLAPDFESWFTSVEFPEPSAA